MIYMIKLDWLSMKYYRARIVLIPIFMSIYGTVSEVLIIPVVVATVVMTGLFSFLHVNDRAHEWMITVLQWASGNPLSVAGIFVGLAVLFLVISYLLSNWFYGRREL